jgi:hypothetical protein
VNAVEHNRIRTRGLTRNERMSVADLWREWTEETDQQPSLRSMEATDIRWRTRDPTESRYYLRRKPILDAIEARIRDGMSEDGALAFYERMRGSGSLNALAKRIKEAQTQGNQEVAVNPPQVLPQVDS